MTEPFTTSVKVSVIAAIALVLPVILWQIWAFFAPAVAPNFERVALFFVVVATALFAAGVVFMYYVVLPRALDFLTNFDDEFYDNQIRASYYLTFVSMTLLGGGLAFLMPIFVLALVKLRILTSHATAPEPQDRVRDPPRLRRAAPDRRPGLARLRDRPARAPLRGLDLGVGADGAALAAGRDLGRGARPSPRPGEGPLSGLGRPGRGPARSATAPSRSATTGGSLRVGPATSSERASASRTP